MPSPLTSAAPPAPAAAASNPLLRFARRQQLYFILAIVIGVTAGLAVVAFRKLIAAIHPMLISDTPSVLRVVLVPTIGGLVIAFLVLQWFPRARGSGVNQTKAALYIYDGYIPFRTVIGKFITAALSIGTGQSLGPEDPSLQVGAGMASLIGRRLKLSRARQRLLAPLGAAAGLAAAFNAPITAVLFVVEEVIGRWSSGVIGAVVLAAASGTMVARWFYGDQPLFQAPRFELRDPAELAVYALMGVVGGGLSVGFIKLVAWLRPRLTAAPRWSHYFQPAAAGLIIGLIGIRFPQVMGTGYVLVNQVLAGNYLWKMLLALALLKIVATALSFTSGAPGGMFAPTLVIGATFGGAMGSLAHLSMPHLTAPIGVYALVGMGTAFAGILRAPMTSVFMVVEVSGSYDIVLPLMISNTIAYMISRRYQPIPIFDMLTQQDGLQLPSMEERREEETLHVEDAMRPPGVPVVMAERPVREAMRHALAAPKRFLLVEASQDGTPRWFGLTPERLATLPPDQTLREAFAEEPGLPLLYPDQPLEEFLRNVGEAAFLPVIHRANGLLLGVVGLTDALNAYHRAANAD